MRGLTAPRRGANLGMGDIRNARGFETEPPLLGTSGLRGADSCNGDMEQGAIVGSKAFSEILEAQADSEDRLDGAIREFQTIKH